jgi:hypothetical protein
MAAILMFFIADLALAGGKHSKNYDAKPRPVVGEVAPREQR